jgi:hypothetical protein
MRIREFEFNRRELAGAMSDFGTLLPSAAGYIAVCGLDPSGFLVMMGLFKAFPEAILGAMMVLVAWQLIRPVVWLRGREMGFALFTGILAAVTSMAVGAVAGVIDYHLWQRLFERRLREGGE